MRAADETSRPRPVLALAVVQILLGIFSFFGGFVHIFLGIGSVLVFTGSYSVLGTVASALGTALVGFGILFVVAGFATLWRYGWAWEFGLGVGVAGLAAGLVSLGLGTVGSIPGIALAIIVLVLLYRPPVRSYLGRRSPTG